MILQNPACHGPGRYKQLADKYNTIPMMCELKHLFKCDQTTGRLHECENALNELIRLRDERRLSLEAEEKKVVNGPLGPANASKFSDADRTALRKLEQELESRFPLPERPVTIRWVCPKAARGDFVMYTGLHGNVSSTTGVTCVQHVDYIPDIILDKHIRAWKNLDDAMSESLTSPFVFFPEGDSYRHLKPFEEKKPKISLRRRAASAPPVGAGKVAGKGIRAGKGGVAPLTIPQQDPHATSRELREKLMKKWVAQFSEEIVDVGSGSARTGEEELLYCEFRRGAWRTEENEFGQALPNTAPEGVESTSDVGGPKKKKEEMSAFERGFLQLGGAAASSGGRSSAAKLFEKPLIFDKNGNKIPPLLPELGEETFSALKGMPEPQVWSVDPDAAAKHSASMRVDDHDGKTVFEWSPPGPGERPAHEDVPAQGQAGDNREVCASAERYDAYFKTLSRKGYLVVKASELFEYAGDRARWHELVNTGVREVEDIFNFSMLYNNVPLLTKKELGNVLGIEMTRRISSTSEGRDDDETAKRFFSNQLLV